MIVDGKDLARSIMLACGAGGPSSMLHAPELAILLWLDEHERALGETPACVNTLCEVFDRSCGSLSPAIDRLAARGHVEKKRARFDHRRNNVTITPKGRQLLARARRLRNDGLGTDE